MTIFKRNTGKSTTVSYRSRHLLLVISVQTGKARILCFSVYGLIAGIVTLCTGQPLLYVYLTERILFVAGQSRGREVC